MNQALQMNTNFHFSRTKRPLAALACALVMVTQSVMAKAGNDTALASAAVLATPVVVTKTADLSFGKFAAGTAGSITISTSGTRSVSGGVLAFADGPAMTAAAFVVSGAPGAAYSITHSGTATLSRLGGVDTMLMTKSSAGGAAGAANGTTNAAPGSVLNNGSQTIYIGATLDVGAGQAGGSYSGTLAVTVEYN
ncbi:hypothetical protein CR103_07125 [Massilia psychrophila]|uniref:DUF4402 domain-containing protein n=2 Tax=Massilia psychrophila TaxID=1603353 RepID=A0A2G8T397_9BURK|nr:hypothetical protein CR103_07125 [Massilia psychrophila]GGE77200.1 hypothetical protein GCM10008020_22450 [Massilia psychrophila]